MGYTNNFDVSYSRGGDSSSSNSSHEQGGVGTGYVTGSGGGSGRGSGGSGRGAGRGVGRGQGRGMRNSGQGCTNTQNQFIAEQENNPILTEVDSAIKNLNLSDLPQSQIITQEISQLEIIHHKKITFIKKQSKEEYLEVIIEEIELLNKKSRKNVIR